MTTIYLATGDVLAIVRRRGEGWRVTLALEGSPTQCVAIDPLRPERVNCGTFGRGLWRSEDAGTSWRSAGEGIPQAPAPGGPPTPARSTTRTRSQTARIDLSGWKRLDSAVRLSARLSSWRGDASTA